MKTTSVFVIVVASMFTSVASAAITVETVLISDMGNPNDPATSNLYGGVNYAYSIGKYEVTVGQYAAFLNAVAGTDTYGLYDPKMATDLNVAGISQSCSSNCTYSVIGSPNHPIAYVSWGDAARFANWLNNGQPSGAEDASTTEDGSYSLNGATTIATLSAVTRKPGATWIIPTENEWYKAAYYQPAAQGGDSDNYWAYPMKTNVMPYSDQPPGTTPDNTRVGNFYQDDDTANGYDDGYAATSTANWSPSQNYLTGVGSFTSSPSYYGTFDQGGNVSEWDETKLNSSGRVVRGGSWDYAAALTPSVYRMLASFRENEAPTFANNNIGFRVATIPAVPEPSTVLLVTFAVVGLSMRRRELR
jgi:formylglycine-generating enzyme required for sulfatase activity